MTGQRKVAEMHILRSKLGLQLCYESYSKIRAAASPSRH